MNYKLIKIIIRWSVYSYSSTFNSLTCILYYVEFKVRDTKTKKCYYLLIIIQIELIILKIIFYAFSPNH